MRHLASRGVLAVLAGFIALTAIAGALFVVPGLPPEWLEGSALSDYTLPAISLGLVGLVALAAVVAVVVRPDVAGAIGVTAGLGMVAFELVEIWVVGFSLVDYGIGEPVAWLQVVYLAAGALTAGIGYALWQSTAEDRLRRARTEPMAHPSAR
jgi:hypothetical protein